MPSVSRQSSKASLEDHLRILVLEDSDLDAELVCEALAGTGLPRTITRVITRAEFVAAIATPGYDLILADYVLPAFDGLSALALAREHCPDIPFVFVSGTLGEEVAVEALKNGATDYVTKHNLNRLPRTVVRALKEANASRERAKAERALHDLNSTLAARVAARTRERDRTWALSQDLLGVVDKHGILEGSNPAWEHMLGWSEAEVASQPLIDLIHPDDWKATEDGLTLLWERGATARFESRCRRRDGCFRRISWIMVSEDGLAYAVGRDVTVERDASEQLASSNRQLVNEIAERERVEATLTQMQRLEAVGQLTSGVAHDFNNLLTIVLGNVHFLKCQEADDGRKRRLDMIEAAAERGATLTSQLLAFSRRQRLEPKPVAINEVVVGMSDFLRSSIGGTVRLRTVLSPDLWPALVDSSQLELVILNLAINARDAMAVGGSVTIKTSNTSVEEPPIRAEEPTPGDYVEVSVIDTGAGMPPGILNRAFEPFFTTKGVGKGSGLGLAQVYGFTKQSGGGVKILTKVGEGTTVKVYLPRTAGLVPAAGPAERPHPAAQQGGLILVVDDDRSVREVTATMLAGFGFSVIEAGSGRAALDLLDQQASPRLVLLDYAMPGLNGIEAAAEIRRRWPELPILFVTGFADAAALAQSEEKNIILKPFRADELKRQVNIALSGSTLTSSYPGLTP